MRPRLSEQVTTRAIVHLPAITEKTSEDKKTDVTQCKLDKAVDIGRKRPVRVNPAKHCLGKRRDRRASAKGKSQ